jgi:Uma2 family endonuclease
MIAKNPPTTAEELFAAGADYERYELVRGEVRPMSPAGPQHGQIVQEIAGRIWMHVRERGLGRVITNDPGFILSRSPDTVRAPDAAFIRADRIPAGGVPRTYWDLAPDLIVEVKSPDDRERDIEDKIREFLDAGVKVVWLARPEVQTLTVHRACASPVVLTGDQVVTGDDVLAGFECRVGEFFQ